MAEETVVLYRPTGPAELELVKQSRFKRWPPRLPEQPIFYPVANEAYAREIAEKWNTRDSGIGYVTRFKVKKSFMDRHQLHRVGDFNHTEWWIPAEELEELNDSIVGFIEVIGEYHPAAEIKRTGRKKGLVWGVVLAVVILLVIGIFLLTRGGSNAEPGKANAEGPYFSVGSTREEVLRIQGPPTLKFEMVWFYDDSQVQFDSDGRVNFIWNYSKNLKIKPEKLP